MKLNLKYVSIVMDLMLGDRNEENQQRENVSIDENLKMINQELQTRYGFQRKLSNNPYEMYDNFNIFIREIDFSDHSKINDEEILKVDLIQSTDTNIFSKLVNYEGDFSLVAKEDKIHTTLLPKAQDLFSNNFSSLNPTKKFSFNENQNDGPKGVPLKIVNSLFDSLIYIGNLSFSLQGNEIIYENINISSDTVISKEAGFYFLNKKNILVIELLESMYQLFSRTNEKKIDIITNLTGCVTKIGEDFSEVILNFTPNLELEELKNLICQTKTSEYKKNCFQIEEGDYVILSSFYNDQNKSNENSPEHEKTGSLKNYLNIFSEQMKMKNLVGNAKNLISSINEEGNTFQEALIANVNEIAPNFQVKLSILASTPQINHILIPGKIWKITKMFNKELFDKCSIALLDFVSKNCMSNTLSNMILEPQKAHQEVQIFPHIYNNLGSSINPNLNSLQNLACTFSASQPLTIIEGVSGSGKSHLASEIVSNWFFFLIYFLNIFF